METGVYIPIISDYGFKATFGNEADSLFLRTALQALIKSNTPIREVHFDKNAFEGNVNPLLRFAIEISVKYILIRMRSRL